MAEAKRLSNPPRRIERVVVDVVDVPDTIQLTLTSDEADTLKMILGAIGGSPSGSRRCHADRIWAALKRAGVSAEAAGIRTGSLFFSLEPGLDLS